MPVRPARKSTKVKKNRSVCKKWNKKISPTEKVSSKLHTVKSFLQYASLALVTLVFLGTYLFTRHLKTQVASAFSSNSYDISVSDTPSLVFIKVQNVKENSFTLEKIYSVHYNRTNKSMIKVNYNPNMEIDIVGNIGNLELSKAITLLESMHNPQDSETSVELAISNVVDTLESSNKFPLDGYIVYDSESEELINQLIERGSDLFYFVQNSKNLEKYRSHLVSSVSYKNLINFSNETAEVDPALLSEVEVASVATLDSGLLDLAFRKFSTGSLISLEKKSISILNGSKIPGVASYSSNVVENIGGHVIKIGNTPEPYTETILIVDDENSETVRVLKDFFGVSKVFSKNEISQGELNIQEASRSDIVLVIGIDIGSAL